MKLSWILVFLLFESPCSQTCSPPDQGCNICIMSECWWVKTPSGEYTCGTPPFGEGVIPVVPPKGRCHPTPPTTTTPKPTTSTSRPTTTTTVPPGPSDEGKTSTIWIVLGSGFVSIGMTGAGVWIGFRYKGAELLVFFRGLRRNRTPPDESTQSENGNTTTTTITSSLPNPSSSSSSSESASTFNPKKSSTPKTTKQDENTSSSSVLAHEEGLAILQVAVETHRVTEGRGTGN